MNIKHEIREIFRQAEYILGSDNSNGNPDLVPFSEKIVGLATKYSERAEEVEEAFIEDFEKYHECSWELAQVTMFHLRLPEYKEYLIKKRVSALHKDDWRTIQVIDHILSAYSSAWPDKELFYE